jgi:hypothetical protein
MIQPATPLDFDFFYTLYFHPQINPYLLYEMMDKAEFQPIFDDLLEKKVLFIFEMDGQNVGMFGWCGHSSRFCGQRLWLKDDASDCRIWC